MVPEGWKHSNLGDVTEFQRGFDLPKSQREAGDIPIISSGGHSGQHSVAKVERPGIVTGRYGSIGQVFFVEGHHWPLNTTLWVKDFHDNDLHWAYYLLQTIDYAKFSDKTGVPGINRNDIHRIKVGVPPLPEQRKIADILSTWDHAIEKTEALLANARTQKRALMQSLLSGTHRFCQSSKQEMPTGEVPSGWNIRKLGDEVKITSGGTPSRKIPEYWDGNIPWVTTSEVNYSEINDSVEMITEAGLNGSSAKLFPSGTILVAMYGQGKTRGQVGRLAIEASTNQACAALLDIGKSDLGFIFHRLAFDYEALRGLANDGSQKNLSGGLLKSFTISTPPLKEQKRIAEVLDSAGEQIHTIQRNLTKLRTEKKALMQQLLTGKRRVVV